MNNVISIIFSESEEDLLVLKRILESSVFDYYM